MEDKLMKKIVLLFITVFCMCCMVACGGEVKEDASAGGNNEVLGNSADDESVVTTEPTAKPTAEPTAEPTPSPEETLVSLREQAMAEHALIVEHVQSRYDIALEILEVVEGYSNFVKNDTYENVLFAKSLFEQCILEGDINEIIGASNGLNMVITPLLVEYPELKDTEEFKKLVEIPIFDTAFYNGKVDVYNRALSNSTATDFEELPYCITFEEKLEY